MNLNSRCRMRHVVFDECDMLLSGGFEAPTRLILAMLKELDRARMVSAICDDLGITEDGFRSLPLLMRRTGLAGELKMIRQSGIHYTLVHYLGASSTMSKGPGILAGFTVPLCLVCTKRHACTIRCHHRMACCGENKSEPACCLPALVCLRLCLQCMAPAVSFVTAQMLSSGALVGKPKTFRRVTTQVHASSTCLKSVCLPQGRPQH